MLPDHARENANEPCMPAPAAPEASEVRRYLGALLKESTFQTSERNRRFLTYVVEETLEGRADRIKAYNIALAAFDRTEDFDPITDPIVRIEASRLRRSLEHYYLTDGQSDPIRIAIPKGSYAATFSYKSTSAQEMPEAPDIRFVPVPRARNLSNKTRSALALCLAGLIVGGTIGYIGMEIGHRLDNLTPAQSVPSLVILPFEDTSREAKYSFVARSLTYDVAIALNQLPEVAIFGLEPTPNYRPARSNLRSDYALGGSVHVEENAMRVAVFLMDGQTGQYLRSWYIQRNLKAEDQFSVQAAIAQAILTSVENDCTSPKSNLSGQETGVFECRKASVDVAKENANMPRSRRRS